MARVDVDVFEFLDYRAFLAAWFDARKASNPRFSHRQFARMAGQKSPSLLIQVIQRKRNLTDQTAQAFAAGMKLDEAQTSFFMHLIELDQAESDEARNEAWLRVSAERRFRAARKVEGDAWTYLSSVRHPAVRELASLPGFRDDPKWIAKMMRPHISESEARAALDLLFNLGMLQRDPNGLVKPVEVSVATAREVGTLAVHNYHRESADRAREAVGSVSPSERHFLGLTVAIPPELVPVLKEQLNAVQARLLDLCDSSPGLKRRVVQINLHMFPLTEDA